MAESDLALRYNKTEKASRPSRIPRLFRYWSCYLTMSLNVNWQSVPASRKWEMLAAGERTIEHGGRKDGRIRIVKFFSFPRHNPAWNAPRSVTYKATTAQLLKRNSFGFPIPVSLALYASLTGILPSMSSCIWRMLNGAFNYAKRCYGLIACYVSRHIPSEMFAMSELTTMAAWKNRRGRFIEPLRIINPE